MLELVMAFFIGIGLFTLEDKNIHTPEFSDEKLEKIYANDFDTESRSAYDPEVNDD